MNDRATSSARDHLAALTSLVPRAMRSAWVGGIALAVGLAATAVWALSAQRLYRSEAVIMYERGVQSASVGGAEGESPRQVSSRLNDMLTSRQRMEGLIKKMSLYPKVVEQRGTAEAIDEMRRRLNVNSREGYTFRVSFDGESRELAQKVLETLVNGVVEEDGRRRLQEAEETKKFLDGERKRAAEDLKAKEAALATFLTQHPQLAGETGMGATAAGGLLRAADRDRGPAASGAEIASLEMQRASIEEALLAAGQKPNAPASDSFVDPSIMAALTRASSEVTSAQRDLADKQARFTNEHPDVKSALRRVADAEAAQRRAEAAAAAARAQAATASAGGGQVDDGGGRVGSLRRALAAVQRQIAEVGRRGGPRVELPKAPTSVVAIDTEWTRLTREVRAAHDRQAQLESRQFQADLLATLMAGGQGGRLVVVDPPFRPMRPVAGARSKIAMAGGGASLLLALLAMLLRAAFDDRMYGARDVKHVVDDAFVVEVPKLLDRDKDRDKPKEKQKDEPSSRREARGG